jgi:hypothetical protein
MESHGNDLALQAAGLAHDENIAPVEKKKKKDKKHKKDKKDKKDKKSKKSKKDRE